MYKFVMESWKRKIQAVVDLLLTGISFYAAFIIKKYYFFPVEYRGLEESVNYGLVMLLIIIIWFPCLYYFHEYTNYARKRISDILRSTIKASTVGLVILFTSIFILKIEDVSRILLFLFYCINGTLLFGFKIILFAYVQKQKQRGLIVSNVLIIGTKKRAVEIIDLLHSYSHDYHVIGCLDTSRHNVGKPVKNGIMVLGTIDELRNILFARVVDEVIFAMPLNEIEKVESYLSLLEQLGKTFRIVPDWLIHSLKYQPEMSSVTFEFFHGVPTMILKTTSTNLHFLFVKSLFDYLASLVALTLLGPLLILVAVAIKLSSRGPILFLQERVGLNGRKFYIYKFRTMIVDAEKKLAELRKLNKYKEGPVFKIDRDPRIIPFVGTFLRRTSLDEIPQLFNILKGEMSFVGPRPPLQSEVDQYNIWQRRRLSMKPGLTCIWQIQPKRNEISFVEWMNLDLEYIDRWSLNLDLSILLRTVKVVLVGYGR